MFAKKVLLAADRENIDILCRYLIYIFFQSQAWFCDSSSMLFPEALAFCDK